MQPGVVDFPYRSSKLQIKPCKVNGNFLGVPFDLDLAESFLCYIEFDSDQIRGLRSDFLRISRHLYCLQTSLRVWLSYQPLRLDAGFLLFLFLNPTYPEPLPPPSVFYRVNIYLRLILLLQSLLQYTDC